MSLIRANSVRLPLRDESIDLIVTSPPYFALRSYQDAGRHYDGQIGSEPTPQGFLDALWAVTAECMRVLKPSGSMFLNLGDKFAGSGGHNNSGLPGASSQLHPKAKEMATALGEARAAEREAKRLGSTRSLPGAGKGYADGSAFDRATRRQAPDAYNQSRYFKGAQHEVRNKSLMLIPERYRIGCVDRLGLIARQVLIWDKPNGMPESVQDRCRRNFEEWVHITKEPRYFSALDELREPHAPQSLARSQRSRFAADMSQDGIGSPNTLDPEQACNPLGKLPGAVWTIPTDPLIIPESVMEQYGLTDHYAAFPQEWPRRLILGWSPSGICVECGEGRRPTSAREVVFDKARDQDHASEIASRGAAHSVMSGGTAKSTLNGRSTRTITGYACACPEPSAATRPAVVLDPFVGTGTTVMVAKALGRCGIGIDLSADYLRLARWRIEESGHARKSVVRTWNERHREVSLFDAEVSA